MIVVLANILELLKFLDFLPSQGHEDAIDFNEVTESLRNNCILLIVLVNVVQQGELLL
jgi:hypothetical protein